MQIKDPHHSCSSDLISGLGTSIYGGYKKKKKKRYFIKLENGFVEALKLIK